MDLAAFPGFGLVTPLAEKIEDDHDLWLVYESGSKTMSQRMCSIQAENKGNVRVYNLVHQSFYKCLKRDKTILADFIVKMAQALDLIQEAGLVHSDIKPDNILIKLEPRNSKIQSLKIIDYGSSFQFKNMKVTGTTPEYLAPEVLKYLKGLTEGKVEAQKWSFDVWSLGIIILEIIVGFPVWLTLSCKMTTATGKPRIGRGLLAVSDRNPIKILEAIEKLVEGLRSTLTKLDNYSLCRIPELLDLVERMLEMDAMKRISPKEILDHPFVKLYF